MVPSTRPSTLLSYDVPRDRRSIAARVSHLIFGRGDSRPNATAPFILRPGVVWLGQSVLLMPASTAMELEARLRSLGAEVATATVKIEPGELSAFRHRMQRHSHP